MKSSNIQRVALAVLLALVPCYAPTVLAGTTFEWTGAAERSGWSNGANWSCLDVQRDYPGDLAVNDRVIIDQDSPAWQVVDVPGVTLEYLFIGDNHELVLNNGILVTSDEEELGIVRFEGSVTLSGQGTVTARGVLVNSKRMSTTITTTGATLRTTDE